MNLMDKLEKLGLDEVSQKSSAVSSSALLVALESLALSNCEDQPTLTHTDGGDAMRRNRSAQDVESLAAAKMSPMHRSASMQVASGLNMICDMVPTANNEIRAKFLQRFDSPPPLELADCRIGLRAGHI